TVIAVPAAPVFTMQPQSQTMAGGDTVVFGAAASAGAAMASKAADAARVQSRKARIIGLLLRTAGNLQHGGVFRKPAAAQRNPVRSRPIPL
ncbi:MAG: hypothetical protein ABIO39_09485, partial [Caulobacteraceae bacterium]